jgi:hypothetical protein
MASNGSCFHGHLDYFQKLHCGGRLHTKPGDHGTPNTHESQPLILFYFVMCEDPREWKSIEIAFG